MQKPIKKSKWSGGFIKNFFRASQKKHVFMTFLVTFRHQMQKYCLRNLFENKKKSISITLNLKFVKK